MDMRTEPTIKILIVDDLERVRRELRHVLELAEDFQIVGEAADGFQAVHQAEIHHPDVVLMDLHMPGMDGFEATRHIKDRHLARAVVALTMVTEDAARERAALLGADAFVEKGTDLFTLIEAIRRAAR